MKHDGEAICFRRWRGSAVEFSEDELLILLGEAIAKGVFSAGFVGDLCALPDFQMKN